MTAFEKLKIAVEALKTLAALSDVDANLDLMHNASYRLFDSPDTVSTAREALRKMGVAFEVKVK